MLVALLGILKAGAAYVPLDPSFPADRLQMMVEDANLQTIITQRALENQLPEHDAQLVFLELSEIEPWPVQEANLPEVDPHALAYVIFTSGSTGRPKGVQIHHQAVVNFLSSMALRPGFQSEDSILALTTLSFDIAVLELYLPLICGGRVVIVSKDVSTDGFLLAKAIEDHSITVMQATPATWQLLLESGWKGSPSLRILCGGEPLSPELARSLIPGCAQLWNMYGPTETTVWSTCEHVTSADEITIGTPIGNTQVYVVDPCNSPQPIGVAGELIIGGDGVSRGYLGLPDLTEERFIPDKFRPAMSSRLYRTGDLARVRRDGRIECLGRLDHQVKIRGFRIELGEIEAALRRNEGLRECVVIAQVAPSGQAELIAYGVPADTAHSFSKEEIQNHLRKSLPDYMIPSKFVSLPSLPRTPNGKIDRKALPAPSAADASERIKEKPKGETEQQLAGLWAEILGIELESLGRHDDFFNLGGNSILAARLFARMERQFGKRLPLAILFQSPTLATLAQEIQPQISREWRCLVPIRPSGKKPILFCVHGAGGNVLLYRDLAKELGGEHPFYGIQSLGLDGQATPLQTIEEMAPAVCAGNPTHPASRPLSPWGLLHGGIGGSGDGPVPEGTRRVHRPAGDVRYL